MQRLFKFMQGFPNFSDLFTVLGVTSNLDLIGLGHRVVSINDRLLQTAHLRPLLRLGIQDLNSFQDGRWNQVWLIERSSAATHNGTILLLAALTTQQCRVKRKSQHVQPSLSLIYADLFTRYFYLFLLVQVNTLQVWKDMKSLVYLLPLFTPYTVAQSDGLGIKVSCVFVEERWW